MYITKNSKKYDIEEFALIFSFVFLPFKGTHVNIYEKRINSEDVGKESEK